MRRIKMLVKHKAHNPHSRYFIEKFHVCLETKLLFASAGCCKRNSVQSLPEKSEFKVEFSITFVGTSFQLVH